jgi:glycosyltransferase involved in cell wall biosynthesis
LEIFQACKPEGLLCLLEQYIGDRRQGAKLLLEESQLQGIVDTNTMLENAGFTPEKIAINEAEYALADAIVAGSPFVVDTLLRAGVAEEKIVLAPYGVSSEWLRSPGALARRNQGEPLQIAFVGNDFVRKGLAYALKAVAELGGARTAHLNVFGCGDASRFQHLFGPHATFRGALGPAALREALLRCHAGLLPSLWEGSSYAVLEMCARGLPVVVTPNTGAVVADGLDGFVVPIRSPEAIAEGLRKLLDDSLRLDMARNARQTALRCTWGAYERNLLDGLGISSQPIPA